MFKTMKRSCENVAYEGVNKGSKSQEAIPDSQWYAVDDCLFAQTLIYRDKGVCLVTWPNKVYSFFLVFKGIDLTVIYIFAL